MLKSTISWNILPRDIQGFQKGYNLSYLEFDTQLKQLDSLFFPLLLLTGAYNIFIISIHILGRYNYLLNESLPIIIYLLKRVK